VQEPKAGGGAERFEVRVTSDSHFSWLRTRLSVERTLMSWVRTATALIAVAIAVMLIGIFAFFAVFLRIV
jgi:putative membrane protein